MLLLRSVSWSVNSMWGGFDLGNISQLGNQLGEALQRAKHEIDTKLDQTFTFDEQPPRRSSDSTNRDAEAFTVDASGQLISTGSRPGRCSYLSESRIRRDSVVPLQGAQRSGNLQPTR